MGELRKRVRTEAQKLARQASYKKYRATHREALKLRSKQYRAEHSEAAHREARNAKDRQRRLEHGDAIRAREKVSREKRREKIISKHKEYWADNAEQLNASRRQKRQDNLEATRAADKEAYKRKDKDKKRLAERARYARNKAQEAARKHAAYVKNPDIFAERTRQRRAKKAGAEHHDLTTAQWREIKAAYGYRCAYCGRKPRTLEQEHITAIAKGGDHTVMNVVPACLPCNRRKGAGEPLVPVQPLLLTMAAPRRKKPV